MSYPKFTLFLVFIALFSCKKDIQKQENVTILKGTVADLEEKRLLIIDALDGNVVLDTIDIVDGKFDHKFHFDEIKGINLVSFNQYQKGGFAPVVLISEAVAINIQFDVRNDNIGNYSFVSGGILNSQYQDYYNNVLKPYYSDFNKLHEKFSKYPQDSFRTDEGNKLSKKIVTALNSDKELYVKLEGDRAKMIKDGLFYSQLGDERDYLTELETEKFNSKKSDFIKSINSLATYFIFTESIRYDTNLLSESEEIFKSFRNKFPKHSYTEFVNNFLTAKSQLKVGGQYVNFTAPDIDGNLLEFKSVLEDNKIVLLDLWATWCGPCIIKSRQMLPIYDKYKDRGFNVLGVAGEFKSLNTYKKFMDKEQWPWKNLVELDKQNKIWEKYKMTGGGGDIFLIDTTGEVLAVSPTAEEVEAILKEKLGDI